jgi:uncharacterized hydrophobic protein (TIGR00271 family)
MASFIELLHGGPVDEDDIARIRGALIFEHPDLGKRLIRFGGLLVIASAIATYGLIGDSVATVIGAMIVAPLMLPIMGLAFSISIGDRKAITSSILVGLGGIVTAIVVGYILGLTPGLAFDPVNNTQIMARTAPRLVDLAAAVATGLAGAFALGRKDISDTLPGVAIAISLVPPLADAGILFSSGLPRLALGSLLLFVTNFLAIVITGIIVFGLMGFPQVSMVPKSKRSRRMAVALTVAMVIVVAVPLAFQSRAVAQNITAESRAADATKTWLTGTKYRYVSAAVREGAVNIVITGHGDLPPQQSLQDSLAGQLFGLKVHVDALPSQEVEFETALGGS